MSYEDSFTIRWNKTDFTKHGYIATYVLGECRCKKCKQGWEDWDENETSQKRKANIRSLLTEGKPRGPYRRRTTT